MGESQAIRMTISDILNAQNQLYEYTAANVHFSPLYRSSIIKMFLRERFASSYAYNVRRDTVERITYSCLRNPDLVTVT